MLSIVIEFTPEGKSVITIESIIPFDGSVPLNLFDGTVRLLNPPGLLMSVIGSAAIGVGNSSTPQSISFTNKLVVTNDVLINGLVLVHALLSITAFGSSSPT